MDESSEPKARDDHREGSWLRRLAGGGRRAPAGDQEAAEQAARARAGETQRSPVSGGSSLPTAIWTDSHCHLQDDPDPAETVALARAARVGRMICAGTDDESSRHAVRMAAELSASAGQSPSSGAGPSPLGRGAEVWATVGLHPHDAKVGLATLNELIGELSAGGGLRRQRVVAIGECGLDYHYDSSPREVQRDVFAAQVALAHQRNLALVIHTREAWDDTFSILEREGVPARTVFHCFTGGEQDAKQCLGVGGFLSFSGIVTFANAEELRQVVVHCPLDSLLIETDSPFLTPVPHRGRRNSPSNVTLVGNAIGQLKALEPEVLAAVTWMNADKAFGIGV
ncbi:MAG: TatD family hydrolase [Acidimicrobiales bacterium]